MQYRVFFTTGQSLLISQNSYQALCDILRQGINVSIQESMLEFAEGIIFAKEITHIIPEPEVSSGITSSPTPDDLRDQKHKQEEAIKSDPKAILERATKKYDEGGDK